MRAPRHRILLSIPRKVNEFLRDGAWLIEPRVILYSWAALVVYAVLTVVVLVSAPDVVSGKSVGRDFSASWAAGTLALEGHAAQSYDRAALETVQQRVFTGDVRLGWFYPPVFLLVGAALALLPYGWAQLTWLGVTGAGYFAALQRIFPHPRTPLVAIAWPAFMVNVLYSQNGFLSTALLGFGLALLEAQPIAAGLLLGALCYKPQLALLVPIALLAGGYWRALAAMAASVAALCAGSVAAFGIETWLAFLDSMAHTRSGLESGISGYFQMVTVFAAVRWTGGSVAAAWLAQGVVSVGIVATVVWAWRSRAPILLKGAILAAAIPLATPYGLLYDLLIEAIAVAGLVREGLRTGFRAWERTVILLTWFLPAAAPPLAWATGVPLAPAIEIALVTLLVRRVSAFGLAGQQRDAEARAGLEGRIAE